MLLISSSVSKPEYILFSNLTRFSKLLKREFVEKEDFFVNRLNVKNVLLNINEKTVPWNESVQTYSAFLIKFNHSDGPTLYGISSENLSLYLTNSSQ